MLKGVILSEIDSRKRTNQILRILSRGVVCVLNNIAVVIIVVIIIGAKCDYIGHP